MASAQLLANVERAEGCRLTAYRDSRGFWTIGYGHLLTPQSVDWTGYAITQTQADAFLAHDLDTAALQCATLPEWASLDTDCRRDAITECIFNLGLGHWSSEFPQTRAALRAKQWNAASQHLMQSPEWISQVGLPRVARLADYIQSGSYSLQPASSSAP